MSNSDEDASTKQVLNYYKNYSQNPHLQKYFSGGETVSFTLLDTKAEKTSIPDNVPKIVITESSTKVIDISQVGESPVDDVVICPNFKIPQVKCIEEFCGTDCMSPDYMKRSNSLPTKLCPTEVQLDLSHISSTENVKVLVFESSTSSTKSSIKPEETHLTTSSCNSSLKIKSPSSSSSEEGKKILSFGLTLSQLKEKVGLPIAFSTPTFALGDGNLLSSGKESTPSPKNNLSVVPKEDTCEDQGGVFSQIPDSICANKHMKSKKNIVKGKKKEKLKNVCVNEAPCIDSTPKLCVKPERNTRRLELSSVEEEEVSVDNYTKENTMKLSDIGRNAQKCPERKTVELSRCEPISVDCFCENKAEIAIQTDQCPSRPTSNSAEDSSCDSFEYISSNVDSSKKTDQTRRRNDSTISSSDKDGDLDKLIDVLQIVLMSNKKKSDNRKQQVKKIIKRLLSTSESDLQASSSSSGKMEAAKHSRRPSSSSEHCSQMSSSGDYLLKFAENERRYQIAWIDNEIGHLSKLKKFLETKKCDQKRTEGAEKKQSRYKVVSADQETSNAPQREYVIETDMSVPADANINYMIDGKQFSVNPPEIPRQDNQCPIFADIAIESKPSSTNIRISTFCKKCKQSVCACNTIPLSNYVVRENALASNVGDMNSLEQAFHNCDCQTAHSDETCPLVQKLAKHFTRYNTDKATTSVSVQARLPGTSETATKETQVMWQNQNVERDSVYIPEIEHNREVSKPFQFCTSERSLESVPPHREREALSLQGHSSRFGKKSTIESLPTSDTGHNKRIMDPRSPDPPSCHIIKETISQAVQTENNHHGVTEKYQESPPMYKNNETDQTKRKPAVDVPEPRYYREITSLSAIPTSDKSLDKLKETAVQTDGNQPERMTKEVQARVETLDRQVQYLKTLLKQREDKVGQHQDSSSKTQDEPHQPIDKMIQTDVKPCPSERCEAASEQTGSVNEGEKRQVTREMFVEYRSTSDQMIQTDNDVDRDGMQEAPSATSATYSQLGSTSLSIPTSILDAQAASQPQTCACCGKTFPPEEAGDGNTKPFVMCCCKKYSLAYCTNPLMRCYCNGRSCKRNNYYCICDKNQSHKYKTYCKRCRKKLLDTMKQQKQGMAYTLILEENPNYMAENEVGDKPRRFDEQVKVQIPKKPSSKKSKDRRNSHERNKQEKVQSSGDATVDNQRTSTLQEYLIENKPEFIYTAEYRRQLLLNSRIWRERNKDALKMHFLENQVPANDGKFKLYSEQQMKEITKRNYEKLPEVRQKHVNKYKSCLKEADKAICERFARKIQKSVLRGKSNFPIDRNVVNI